MAKKKRQRMFSRKERQAGKFTDPVLSLPAKEREKELIRKQHERDEFDAEPRHHRLDETLKSLGLD